MEEKFKINEYHFKARKSCGLGIYARTKETALKMAETINLRHKNLSPYKPKLFGFEIKCLTDRPPLELENECWKYVRTYKRSF